MNIPKQLGTVKDFWNTKVLWKRSQYMNHSKTTWDHKILSHKRYYCWEVNIWTVEIQLGTVNIWNNEELYSTRVSIWVIQKQLGIIKYCHNKDIITMGVNIWTAKEKLGTLKDFRIRRFFAERFNIWITPKQFGPPKITQELGLNHNC